PARDVEPPQTAAGKDDTKPLPTRVEQHPRPAPAEIAKGEPIGFVHNFVYKGCHFDNERRFRRVEEFVRPTVEPGMSRRPSRHGLPDDAFESPRANSHPDSVRHRRGESELPTNRHYRVDPGETADDGRHSFRED